MAFFGRIKVFWIYLITYVAVLLLPVGVSLFAYLEALTVVRSYAEESMHTMLEQNVSVFDRTMQEVRNMAIQLSQDPDLAALLVTAPPKAGGTEILKLVNAQRKVESLQINSSFSRLFYLLYRDSEFVVSNYRINIGFEFHFRYFLSFENMPYEDWLDLMFGTYHYGNVLPCTTVLVEEAAKRVVPYLASFPSGFSGEPQGAVLILVDESFFADAMENMVGPEHGWAYVMDDASRIIVSRGDIPVTAQDADERYIIATIRSPYNGWTHTAALPYQSVMAEVLYLKYLAIIFLVLSLAIGTFVSLFFARRNSRKLSTVASLVRSAVSYDPEMHPNEYTVLSDGVAKLVAANSTLRDSVKRQTEMLHVLAVDRLLRGEIRDESEMDALAKQAGFVFPWRWCFVIAIAATKEMPTDARIDGESALHRGILKVVIDRSFASCCSQPWRSHMIDLKTLAVVVFSNDALRPGRESIRNMLEAVAGGVRQALASPLCFAVGMPYPALDGLNKSLREARSLLDLHGDSLGRNRICFHDDHFAKAVGFYYPLELETRLYTALCAGNTAAVVQFLDDVFAFNFERMRINGTMAELLLSNLRGTLVEYLNNHREEESCPELFQALDSNGDDAKRAFRAVAECFRLVSEKRKSMQKSHNERLFEGIRRYVRESFADPRLSVTLLADEFHISPTYFSQFFSEHAGVPFSKYLERLRIQEACRLLSVDELSIKEIAYQVGYGNHYTFRRAFKRETGVVPTRFAEAGLELNGYPLPPRL
jgi:AraC-like DNA-binding protein